MLDKLDRLSRLDNLPDHLKQRLAALRSRAAEIEGEQAVVAALREDPERLIAEVEAEAEQAELDAKLQRRALEAGDAYRAEVKKRGRHLVTLLPTCHGPIVLRCPPAAKIQEMAERVSALQEAGDARGADETAQECLATEALVYPDADTFLWILGEHPGVATDAANAIEAMARGRADIAGKGA